ncbi:MAG: (5-formylfuran-3-yl)methyl phosphate synthase [Gemmataceae bacterium]|nr:(5-formylfuran-3-yl)methyl phosphate synthase [Gemmataceae bacterium]
MSEDPRQPGLLVSVRSVAEAEAALAGGADLIDVKEPARGPLGRADDAIVEAVIRTVARRRPVSAAMGELPLDRHYCPREGLASLDYVKWGLAGWVGRCWQSQLLLRIAGETEPRRGVAVAYADRERARAPAPSSVCAFACEQQLGVFLIDTYQKDGRTLLDWMTPTEIEPLVQRCRDAGVRVALAGSLGVKEIGTLRGIMPDWFAVRGAACIDGRDGTVAVERVRDLGHFVRSGQRAG